MHARAGFVRSVTLIALVGGALGAALPLGAYGDPPPWAPAHGKRKQGDPYTGYSGKKWERHYGVINGRCNREAIGAAVGAAAGGAIGAQVGQGETRQVAIVVGAVTGAILGAKIGRDMDDADRACIGHSLELVGDKKAVTWMNPDQRRTYRLTPVRGVEEGGVKCREFDFRVTTDGGAKKTNRVKACPAGDGTWRLLG
jgi:surface antigen